MRERVIAAGVDSSTQSTTVVLRDVETGQVLGIGSAPHPPTFPPVSEQSPEDWWDALVVAMRRARDAAGAEPADIQAVSVAAQCHGLVALDADGSVIRPAKLWNDTTSDRQAQRLRDMRSVGDWVSRIGSVPPAAFTISKLLWLSENEPENFRRLATVLLPHDWITWRLCGNLVTDRSDASGTGYYSAARGGYDHELLALVDPFRDWQTMLPTVLRHDEVAGMVAESVASELGVASGAIVGAGSGDQHASAVGLGVREGDIVFVFGTSGVVYGLSRDPVLDNAGFVNCVADATGGYQPLICTLNAAKVTDTFARILGVDHQELSRLALSARAGGERPVLVAYLDGERTPERPMARGTLAGLTNATSREDVARAAYEGVILGLLEGYRALVSVGVPHDGRVFITGGGAASQAYRQLLADWLERDILLVSSDQPVAEGAALLAATLLSGQPTEKLRESWAPTTSFAARPRAQPETSVRDRYETLASWRGMEQATEPLLERQAR